MIHVNSQEDRNHRVHWALASVGNIWWCHVTDFVFQHRSEAA